ncbi:hypothetical protein RF11_05636 [Thelohanellus kitauei]|uniref:Alpha-soluble NSF attachment protein n=1 Tax=Thelohanellus kitauei TaxID=669202 RepID=A0A0C2MLM9_THEKT|nr:hypothetical protein RF11_05636 [Thelohanellus kitauei]
MDVNSAPSQSELKQFNELHSRYINTAQGCKEMMKWEDAGNAYYEAAKIAEGYLIDVGTASSNYLSAGNCYRRALSEQAYETYLKCIDAHLKYGAQEEATAIAVRCGYMFDSEYGDIVISNEFYDKADELREKYNLEHNCAFSTNYMHNFLLNISDALNNQQKYRDQFDWIKVYQQMFKNELTQTIAYVEELSDTSKNVIRKREPAQVSQDA